MSDQSWFLFINKQVRGPFAQGEIASQVGKKGDSLIWGRGQSEWMTYDQWKSSLAAAEAQRKKAPSTERMWQVREGNVEYPPMSYNQMIELLKTKSNHHEVRLWTQGYSDWKEIYQIHKILDDLGVSRRSHPRVPISGEVLCETGLGSFQGRVISISEGGLGLLNTPQLNMGEKLKVIVKSPSFFGPIHASCEVVYTGNQGDVGLKFMGIQTESKSAIIEYVKKFLDEKR